MVRKSDAIIYRSTVETTRALRPHQSPCEWAQPRDRGGEGPAPIMIVYVFGFLFIYFFSIGSTGIGSRTAVRCPGVLMSFVDRPRQDDCLLLNPGPHYSGAYTSRNACRRFARTRGRFARAVPTGVYRPIRGVVSSLLLLVIRSATKPRITLKGGEHLPHKLGHSCSRCGLLIRIDFTSIRRRPTRCLVTGSARCTPPTSGNNCGRERHVVEKSVVIKRPARGNRPNQFQPNSNRLAIDLLFYPKRWDTLSD